MLRSSYSRDVELELSVAIYRLHPITVRHFPTLTLASDLGVFDDSNLTFKQHIGYVRLLLKHNNAGIRVFFSRLCYKIVKHCSQNVYNLHSCYRITYDVWNPSKMYLIDQLENVQRIVI